MKKIFSTILSGYVGLLFPLIVVFILLEKLHHIIQPVVLSIEKMLNITRILGVIGIFLISIVIMLIIGYLAGLLLKSAFVKNKIALLEENVLSKIPVYNLIKSIFGTSIGVKKSDSFRPALLGDERSYSLCYVTNEGESFYTVYVCEGGLNGGEIRIVRKEDVKLLNVHLSEFTRLIKQYGVNSTYLIERISN